MGSTVHQDATTTSENRESRNTDCLLEALQLDSQAQFLRIWNGQAKLGGTAVRLQTSTKCNREQRQTNLRKREKEAAQGLQSHFGDGM